MTDEAVRRRRPARPHHKLTDDGRRMREVLSYSRRGSRFTPRQQQAWTAYAERWWVPDEAVDEPGFTLSGLFGREAPLIVEIGSGIGESTVELARTRPDHDVVALEVWRPGVADTLGRIGEAGLVERADARASTPSGRSSTWSSRVAWPGSGSSSPTPGTRRSTTSAG